MSSENALSPHYNANSNLCLASRIITVAEQNSTVNSFKVFRQRTRKQPLWGNMAFVCVQGPKSVCTKQHFSLCTDFNLSDKNLIQLCFFQRELKQIQEHCRKYPPPPHWCKQWGQCVPLIKGMAMLMTMRNLQAVPRVL